MKNKTLKTFFFIVLFFVIFGQNTSANNIFDLKQIATQPKSGAIDLNRIDLNLTIETFAQDGAQIYRGIYPDRSYVEGSIHSNLITLFTPFSCGQICSQVSSGDIFFLDIPSGRIFGTMGAFDTSFYLSFKFLGIDSTGTHFELIGNGQYTQTTPPETCDTTDVFCFLRNALRWAVEIDTSVFNKFTLLKDELAQKPPFGYITSLFTEINSLNNNPANEIFVLQQVTPITEQIFSPLRTGLAWLLWFVFAFALFHRFKDINI